MLKMITPRIKKKKERNTTMRDAIHTSQLQLSSAVDTQIFKFFFKIN
jgi:hypothetical protein